MKYTVIEELVGKTFDRVERDVSGLKCEDSWYDDYIEDGNLTFLKDEKGFTFYHAQDCCESVSIEDIAGDLSDLEGSPIIKAEKRSESGDKEEDEDGYSWGSETWTFYEFATIKGSVTVRWYGSSNGYYSESVDFAEVELED